MGLDEIKKLFDYDIKNFENVDEFLDFGFDEIEKHIPELRELKEKKDSHLLDKIADVYIWSKMLMISKDINEEIVLKRINRFKEKIEQNQDKK